MNVNVCMDAGPTRRWIDILIRRIGALPGASISVDRRPGPRRDAALATTLLRAEALLGRTSLAGWAAISDGSPACPARSSEPDDLVLDLRGDASEGSGSTVWRLTFDGAAGDAALLAALMAGRTPHVAITEAGRVVVSARVGTEAHGSLLSTFEDALARTTTLVVAALRGLRPAVEPIRPDPWPSPVLSPRRVAGHTARRAAAMLCNGLDRLRYRRPHWRVGWRRLDGPDLIDLRAHPASGWTDLPDNGTRFYADPFPIEHEGRTVLFVEDYVYSHAKAVISAVAFGPDGPLGVPVPVLDEPHHLSYPFVFARGGDYWMIPESCAAGTVDLYRARRFPGGWVKEETLLSGVVASDATLVEHAGLWWMLASVREAVPEAEGLAPRGSFSDTLYIWSAPDFRGPWVPHPRNPVLIDIASARPAGRVVARGGVLIRPVQDCRRAYGGALALARIDRLDGEGYGQTVEARLEPGPIWAGSRLHTLNRSGAFEFIDGAGRVPRRR